MTNQEIVLTDEGAFVRSVSLKPIADEMLLKNYFEADEKLVYTPNVFHAGGHFWSLYTKGSSVFALTQLKTIQINANWIMQDEGKVKFCRNADPMAVRATMTVIPEDQWFACVSNKHFYIAVHRNGQIYRPPLPNFFDDGHMCQGNNDTRYDTLQACVASLMDIFVNASYNNDLWHRPCDNFLLGELQADGSLRHTPKPYDLTEVISGKVAEVYEHAIKRNL